MRQPSPHAWHGFMAFAAEAPLCGGMADHPAWSPQWQPNAVNVGPVPDTAEAWAVNYSASKDRFALELEAADTVASILENRDEDDDEGDEEPDVVLQVAIDPDGTLFVYANVGDADPVSVYTKHDVYSAFGMEAP